MSHYIAGGLMILLLLMTTLFGVQAYAVYDAARMVDAALQESHLQLAADGGVSGEVRRQIRRRVQADGGDTARLTISGSHAHTPAGKLVTVRVIYEQPYLLAAGNFRWQRGALRIERTASVVSGWQP